MWIVFYVTDILYVEVVTVFNPLIEAGLHLQQVFIDKELHGQFGEVDRLADPRKRGKIDDDSGVFPVSVVIDMDPDPLHGTV